MKNRKTQDFLTDRYERTDMYVPHHLTKGEVLMGVDYKNPEGYADSVPYQAITNIEKEQKKFRPIIYICSAFSGDVEGNMKKARAYSRFAVDQGAIPIAPHLLLPQYMKEGADRQGCIYHCGSE